MEPIPEADPPVPDFLREKFESEPAARLESIAEFAAGPEGHYFVPEYVREAFAVQDDETRAAVGTYAGELAAFLENEGHRTVKDAREARRGAEEDGDDDTGGSSSSPGFMSTGRNQSGKRLPDR